MKECNMRVQYNVTSACSLFGPGSAPPTYRAAWISTKEFAWNTIGVITQRRLKFRYVWMDSILCIRFDVDMLAGYNIKRIIRFIFGRNP